MKFNIITLFPNYFESPLKQSLLAKAIDKKILNVEVFNLRDYAVNKYGKVDDMPYGGGPGMVLMVEPLARCINTIEMKETSYKVLLTPRGYSLQQARVIKFYKDYQLKKYDSITLICGHYEGLDERITNYVDESISIGSYILSGGEIASLVLLESISRYIPNFMKDANCLTDESYCSEKYIEYPQYSRPADYDGYRVPEVLTSGNHQKIKDWRAQKSKEAWSLFMNREADEE